MVTSRMKFGGRFAVLAVFASLFLTSSVDAAMMPSTPQGISEIQWASGGCGQGMRRNAAGHCVRDIAACPAGTHVHSFVRGGERRHSCIPN
jgi:hypothetical protein